MVNTSYIIPRESRVADARSMKDLQRAMQRYTWGTTDPGHIDLTDPATLKTIMHSLNPMLLRNNSHSGVTLVLEAYGASERSLIDNLMGQYKRVAYQSSTFIYQHATMDSSAAGTRTGAQQPTEKQQAMLDALTANNEVTKQYVDTVKVLNDMTKSAREDGAVDPKSEDTDTEIHTLYLKLYPQTCAIGYPRERIAIKQLSGSRLLPVSNGRTNPMVSLRNILAYNTYDTQWLDIYTSFFDLWFKHFANRKIDVIIGDYILRDMILQTSPTIVNNYKNIEFFDVSLVSEHTELRDFVR